MRRVLGAWDRFWFEPVEVSTLAVFRIVFGLIMLGWAVSLLPEVYPFFTRDSILPKQPTFSGDTWGAWGILGIFPSNAAVVALMVAFLLAAACLLVGFFTRAAAVVVFVTVLSLERRNPFVFNSGDVLLRAMAFYVMLAPTGAALSVDRWLRHRGRFWEFPRRAPWALRLMQLQVSVVYFTAVWTKVRGTTWNNGTAVSYALRIADLNRFPVPSALANSLLISNLLTYGTLVIELSIAILVWNRKLRPWVLLLGLSLHFGIEYSIRVGFYGLAGERVPG
jgi:hypothetical protein